MRSFGLRGGHQFSFFLSDKRLDIDRSTLGWFFVRGGRIPSPTEEGEYMVFLVAAFCIFTFFFIIKYLFLGLVRAGYVLAFEVDLSSAIPIGCSLLFYVDWASVMFRLRVLFISGSVFVYCCFYIHGDSRPDRFC